MQLERKGAYAVTTEALMINAQKSTRALPLKGKAWGGGEGAKNPGGSLVWPKRPGYPWAAAGPKEPSLRQQITSKSWQVRDGM